jgi:WD40 repeat protein
MKDDQRVRRFEREARAAARLHHTNIVPVFGSGRWSEGHDSATVYYYVMQFISGLGLDAVLAELRSLRSTRSGGKFPVPSGQRATESLRSPRPTLSTAGKVSGEAVNAGASPPSGRDESSAAGAAHLPSTSDLSCVSDADRRYRVAVARIGLQVAEALAHSVAWHPDGNRLASGGLDTTVRVWYADESERPSALRNHLNNVRCVSWSPDGSCLASAGQDHTVRLWNAETLHERSVLRGHVAGVNFVSWSADGKSLASGGVDGRVLLWNADSRDESHAVLDQEGSPPTPSRGVRTARGSRWRRA